MTSIGPDNNAISSFVKVNLGGRGYVHLSLEGETRSPMALDRLLPTLRERPSLPSVAYSATRTGQGRAVGAVGGFWPQNQDEFGRAGISFWYGEDWDVRETRGLVARTASRLIAIVNMFQSHHERLGDLLRRLVEDPDSIDIPRQLILPLRSSSFTFGGRGERVVRDLCKALTRRAGAEGRENFLVGLPYDWRMGIPMLTHLLLASGRQVSSVGGGDIAVESIEKFDAISIDGEVSGFASVYVGEGGYSRWRVAAAPSLMQAEVTEKTAEVVATSSTERVTRPEGRSKINGFGLQAVYETGIRIVRVLLVGVGVILGVAGVATMDERWLEVSAVLLLIALLVPGKRYEVEQKDGSFPGS